MKKYFTIIVFLLISILITSCTITPDKPKDENDTEVSEDEVKTSISFNQEDETIVINQIFNNNDSNKGVIISFSNPNLDLVNNDLKYENKKEMSFKLSELTQNKFYYRVYYNGEKEEYEDVIQIDLADYIKELNNFTTTILERENYITVLNIDLDTKIPMATPKSSSEKRYSAKASNSSDYNYIYVNIKVNEGYKLFKGAKLYINDLIVNKDFTINEDLMSATFRMSDPNWSGIY